MGHRLASAEGAWVKAHSVGGVKPPPKHPDKSNTEAY